jgi:hypothetical protein
MSAFVNCPGPINLFVRPQAQSTFSYLGTAVTSVEPEAEFAWINIMNDLGGRSVPFQIVYDGEEHVIAVTLNRFDSTVLKALRDPAGLGNVVGNPNANAIGSDGAYNRGTLGIGSRDFELFIQPTYTSGTVFNGLAATAPDFPLGRRYFSCVLEKYKESTVGTRVQEEPLIIRTHNTWSPVVNGNIPVGFSLFTENPANFPTVSVN